MIYLKGWKPTFSLLWF